MPTDVVEESVVFRAEKQGVVQAVEFFFFSGYEFGGYIYIRKVST